MARPRSLKPSYCFDKSSGRAFVTLNGKRRYLGRHSTQESRDRFDAVVGEWIAAGRTMPATTATDVKRGPTISVIIAGFWNHALQYYRRPDGTPTSELSILKTTLRPMRRLYGATRAADFQQRQLKALREEMIRLGWCRRSINKNINRVRGVFKWAAENQLVSGQVYHDLRTVAPLKMGRSDAKETAAVKPVPAADIAAVRAVVSRQVRAMIDLQLLTGARPGEICAMRTCDIDRGGKVWLYTPATHKTAHHGHDRVIRIGPRAQKLIEPFFKPDLQAFMFSPADAVAERLEAMHRARTTPIDRGNVPGSNRVDDPKRKPRDRYTVTSYRRAIARACEAAFVMPRQLLEPSSKAARRAEAALPGDEQKRRREDRRRGRREWRAAHTWHPHQLRHNAGTTVRREFGAEASRVILGHRSLDVTEIYAEIDGDKADAIIAAIG